VSAPRPSADAHGRSFWIGLAIGSALMLWGAWLYLDATPDAERRASLVRWIVGLDLAHDLLLAPVVVLVGLGVARAVPSRVRAVVQACLIASTFVVLVGLPPLLGTYSGDNATIQPIAYGPAVLVVLCLIWGVGALSVVVNRRRQRREVQ